MKINARELTHTLKKAQHNAYWISGNEHLLVSECATQVQQAFKLDEYTEVLKLNVDKSFEPGMLLALTANNSLFSERQLILIHLDEKWPAAFAETLSGCINNADCQFIISSPKLSSQQTNSKWVKTLDKTIAFVPIWPIDAHELPGWLTRRAKQLKLDLHLPAAHFIAECTEGNLLASAQALEKLSLECTDGQITLAIAEAALSDLAHYDIYNLIEACLLGHTEKALKIFHTLQQQSFEPTILIWAFCQEIRTIMTIMRRRKNTPEQQLFKELRIFSKRQGPVKAALNRLNPARCAALLQTAAQIDRQIKGVEAGNPIRSIKNLIIHSAEISVDKFSFLT